MVDRRERIVVALMLCDALSREEAEHFLRQYDADQSIRLQDEINAHPEPRVFHLPLRWWRLGKAMALSYVQRAAVEAYADAGKFDMRGYKIR